MMCRFVVFAATLLFIGISSAQEDSLGIDREPIEAKITALKAAPDPDKSVLAGYEETLAILDEQNRLQEQIDNFQARLDSLDSDLKNFQDEMATVSPDPVNLPEDLDGSEKALREIDSELEAASGSLESLTKAEIQNRARDAAIPAEIQKVNDAVEATPPPPPVDETSSELQKSRQIAQTARLSQLKLQLALLNLEKEYLERVPPLVLTKKNLAAKKLENLTEAKARMSSHVTKLRNQIAKSTVQEAKESLQLASDEPENIKALARENVELANRRNDVAQLLSEATLDLTLSEEELRTTTKRLDTAVSRTSILEEAGLSLDSETGFLLRQQRGEMTPAPQLKNDIAKLLRTVTTANLELLKREDNQREFLLSRDDVLQSSAKKESAEELLAARAKLYGELITDLRNYVNVLDERLHNLQKTRAKVIEHQNFVDERLLWIRSSPFFGPAEVKTDLKELKKITVGAYGQKWFSAIINDIRDAAPLWIAFWALWTLWFLANRKIKNRIVYLNQIARDNTCVKFHPTIQVTFLTICIALTLPVALCFLAWRWKETAGALSSGLVTASIFIFLFEALRQMSKKDGLLTSHLGLSNERSRSIHRNTSWFLLVYPLLLFPAGVMMNSDQLGEAGRVFFIFATLAMGIYLHRLFLPRKHLLSLNPHHQWFLKPVYILAVSIPAFLILGALFGFYHSVVLLRGKIDATIWILALAAFSAGFFLRWVLVSRRHAAIKEAINRRSAMVEGTAEHAEDDRSLEEIQADAAGLVNLQVKTRQLARLIVTSLAAIALWSVWSPTLPALNMLDRIPVWESRDTVQTVARPSENIGFLPGTGSSEESPEESTVISKKRVSLQNLLFSLFVLFLTVVGARNIPAFLDLLILRRFYTKRGGAFAITTSLRYTIIAVGIAYALGHLGIEWSKIQWIAAAITLGVGFGLQEIFANFVAGLIILFERPIRLGDYVTLGDVSGQVSQIRIRATTIIDFSNKELVVPNKEFITGRLVNWTLTDPMFRVEIPVGIAYGSDTALAKEVLEKVGRNCPIALDEPAPKAVFLAFGESTLDFELRVHIRDATHLVLVRSQLLFDIDAAFRESGIEIAFPQRDIHIRSIDAPPSSPPLPNIT
ncbi:MAG: mechanosensitive ion channel [Verrucomicrobiales bacterium]|nr:mechanosensitive ion channel [Verrucomicrobiales bacterium]